MSEQAEKKSYKKTLNLPRTSFAMKANLVQREPEFQKRWDKLDLYKRLLESDHPRGRFILHDGPPYANGPIHLGHLLNKVLKDMVVRSRAMMGYETPFVPGWDCHGLPIEHKVMQERQGKGTEGPKGPGDPEPASASSGPSDPGSLGPSTSERIAVRRACKKYAEKYIKLQSRQMQRLGTIGDYDDPYLTMNPRYEAAVLEVFADLVGKGLVYRDLKPVHWSIANQTALAEAELEYQDREDTSVFVLFPVADPAKLPGSLNVRPGDPISLMIWTTTPWTLPANLAVAASPNAEYQAVRFNHESLAGVAIVAADLVPKIFDHLGASFDPLGTCTGAELEAAGVTYNHPFIERTGPVVTADYVTLEDGTGLVHTAPGHGTEDYQTGQRVGLETYCPVLADGTFDDTAPDWLVGKSVWDGNGLVVERLRDTGHLYHSNQFMHSYPHDWRSKTPVIFRATEQWFIRVDDPGNSLRDKALAVTESGVEFHPEWGRNRMRGMLESRPDWCISRQRAWGLPIPAFVHTETGEPLLTEASVRHVAAQVRDRGSDTWFHSDAAALLDGCPGVDNPGDYEKVHDIFDVWFESGSSWNAVAKLRELGYPVDLYLEGSDQHRGWFQLSLLPAIGATGESPFKAVLTHGFMVDKHGKKMSKSGGNALNVDELFKDYGADVCRWWVASLSYENDIKVDIEFFRLAGEEYRKVRNTIRFLLSNLGDFDAETDRVDVASLDPASVDAWALAELAKLIRTVEAGYESYAFRKVHNAIFHFCNETMSAVYLAATKDRLYCDAPGSERRRRTQTVMHDIADALIRLIAPVMVHTADEAFLALHGEDHKSGSCVHLTTLPVATDGAEAHPGWPEALALRDRVLKHLEDARAQRGIDNPLDAGVEVTLPMELHDLLEPLTDELADLCGVSRFHLDPNGNETIVIEDLRDEPRCERSWKRDGTVTQRSDGGYLTDRDAGAVGV